ncbi:THxN family PEP-CTERM protein [Inhella crocodyli]|jgi:hypothetical protein|uniref:PEP-CTERM sorting domain-containing protein n=1 Tax=Inhella crocodyli TaxID=2499851 RepID=A0A437LKU8_9BURK|nr:THxN family PEP-CTERM protein [Inhella crocodyli]RVT86037.1 PEP-CTERM sorting domain-containing protein [Inhella crocodyli]
MNKLLKLTAAAGVALALSTSASAAMVTQWSYTLTSKWSAAKNTDNANTSGVGTQLLSWGTPATTAGISSLSLTDPAAGTVATNTGIGNGVTVTHNNFPIFGATLASATLQAQLVLTPTLPVPGPTFPPSLQNIDIKFVETPNVETCAVASSTPCRDIFVLDNPSQASGAQQFTYDGITYAITVFPLSLGSFQTLPPAACAAAGKAAGCVGFTTEENQATVVPFGFRISTVSEPGVLALVGFGLAGLGFAARRRKAA